MPSQIRRISVKEFPLFLKRSKALHSLLLTIRYFPTNNNETRLSVVISAKNVPHAIDRNKLKRRLRSIIEKHQTELKNNPVILIFVKNFASKSTFAELEKDVIVLLKKAGIL